MTQDAPERLAVIRVYRQGGTVFARLVIGRPGEAQKQALLQSFATVEGVMASCADAIAAELACESQIAEVAQ